MAARGSVAFELLVEGLNWPSTFPFFAALLLGPRFGRIPAPSSFAQSCSYRARGSSLGLERRHYRVLRGRSLLGSALSKETPILCDRFFDRTADLDKSHLAAIDAAVTL